MKFITYWLAVLLYFTADIIKKLWKKLKSSNSTKKGTDIH